MSTVGRAPRLLLSMLGAAVLAFAHQPAAHAAGGASATSSLQIGVEVVRSCAIDTAGAGAETALDAKRRAALLLAMQSSLASSCGSTRTQVTLADARLGRTDLLASAPRLDIEF